MDTITTENVDTNCCNSGYYLVCDLFYPIAPLQQIHCRLYFDIKQSQDCRTSQKSKRSIETATCSQGVTQAIIIHSYTRQLIIDKEGLHWILFQKVVALGHCLRDHFCFPALV